MNKGIEKIKRAWEENPLQVLMIGAFVATAAAKLISVNTERNNAKVWHRLLVAES